MPSLQQVLLTDSFADWIDKTNLAIVELNSLSGSSLEVISLDTGSLATNQLLAYDGSNFVNISNVIVLGTLAVTGILTATTNVNITSGAYQIGGTSVLTSTVLGSAVVTSSLTTVGTISTGVWGGTVIDELFGGTGFTTYATGDIIYSSASNVLSKLTAGANGKFLSLASGIPSWVDEPAASAPGGANTQVQFNNSSAFGGDPGLIFVASSSDTLSVGVASTSAGIVDLLNTGTYKIDGTNVLSATTLGAAVVSSSLTTVGTISTGVWQGTVITGQYGGSGTNNAGKTVTLGGNLTTSGAFTTTLTVTANTNVTLPTTGTLIIKTAYTVKATSFTAVSDDAYFITGNSVTVTLPASPSNNDYVIVANGATVTGCIISRNGNNIMGLAENITLDVDNFSLRLIYYTATTDWRIT